ncbi:MAG TPA: HAD family phosphatase [Acidimicrobiales bacterium]|nr:HAD family phosphatase [Acidimicrobiales bacterium]
MIDAVVFDLDGVLLDSEQVWDRSRREVAEAHGGRWPEEATSAMQGMSSIEWAGYMRKEVGVDLPEPDIIDAVLEELFAHYDRDLPLLPGAIEAVARMKGRWPLGLASSSNRVVIERVLDAADLRGAFRAVVSSEEVPRGKPSPDVYLEVAVRLGCPPRHLVAVEDSANGIRSAAAAGLTVVAVPNREYPPPDAVLEMAAVVLESLHDLRVDALEELDRAATESRLDEEEVESFPASDPHADWAGPPD